MNYILKKSKRTTLSIEIKPDMSVTVRAPFKCTEKEIESFVESHRNWIENALIKTEAKNKNAARYKIPDSEKELYIKKAKDFIPKRTEYWSGIMGLVPSRVTITQAEKRYGSCSGKNSVCFSYRIMAYPIEAVDYVIVHELAHIKYKNHGKDFYRLIESYLPDYKKYEIILRHQTQTE